ncbi:MAG: tRNA (adenosine(37)-N6)-threonylcarbamoyltransferase complex transferase subunit TsaD, partial [Hyphomicrobiaceae bacterium]
GLTNGVLPPYLLLLVSGGHTQIILVDAVGHYRRIGTTIDDALGEAFDKTAKLLGLGFPGGPAVERHARRGDTSRIRLPRPMIGRPQAQFSFAGLKTAVRRQAQRLAPLSEIDIADLCAGFEDAVCACVDDRIRLAYSRLDENGARARPPLVAAGGVACNLRLRAALRTVSADLGVTFHVPSPDLCADNAAMVAWAGAQSFLRGRIDPLDTLARARWPLDSTSDSVYGSGRLGPKV